MKIHWMQNVGPGKESVGGVDLAHWADKDNVWGIF